MNINLCADYMKIKNEVNASWKLEGFLKPFKLLTS